MTPKSQQELVRMETQAKFPYLIVITTPDNQVYRYANSTTDIEYDDEGNGTKNTFTASYFKLSKPEKTESGIKDASITISSIDQQWIAKIRTYTKRSTIRFIAVIQRTENGSEYIEPIDDITFSLTKADWNDISIKWNMKFDDWMDIKFPFQKFDQFVAPALF